MRNVLITGSSHGIGAAAAIAFAKLGCNVGINYSKSKEGALQVEETCKSYGVKTKVYKADVSKHDECKAMVEDFIATFGKIDVLINNAGFMLAFKKFEDITEKECEEIVNTNFTSYVNATKTLLPLLKESSTPAVINVASSAGGGGCCNAGERPS